LPPDPVTVAPETKSGDFSQNVSFLFSGSQPIQTDVEPGAIEAARTTVLRGRVLAAGGAPLAGVVVTVKDHPELGRTVSRADGRYDLAVNGGGQLVVAFAADGYLPTQRQAKTVWQAFVELPEVTLAAL
ncbi:carboxypeptidase-like regulatory domain-containing protein, partial [Endothiovibrio diazotrophicus]